MTQWLGRADTEKIWAGVQYVGGFAPTLFLLVEPTRLFQSSREHAQCGHVQTRNGPFPFQEFKSSAFFEQL